MHSKLNENIEFIYNNLTNHVIFQSAYSRSQCFEMLGVISTDKYSIIYNGVDKSIFQPATNPVGKKTRLMSTGNFRNLDMLEPLVLSLDSLVKDYDFELILIGPVINDELKPLLNRKYISYQGLQEREQLAKSLQQADIFLYSHLNPPCPNSVLEAISTGLPIVGFDSGSMRELCFFNTELLVPVSDRVFQQYDEFNADLLANVISNCIDNYSYYKEQALKNSNLFDFQDCGQAYVNVFKNQISRD
ncbi:MAG: glycosyltransferase [Cyclobacteriaceae bacterium]